MKRCSYCGKKITEVLDFAVMHAKAANKKVMEKDGPKVKYFIPVLFRIPGDVLWNYIKQQLPDRDGKHSNRN